MPPFPTSAPPILVDDALSRAGDSTARLTLRHPWIRSLPLRSLGDLRLELDGEAVQVTALVTPDAGPPSVPGMICMYGSRSWPNTVTSCVSPSANGSARRTTRSGCCCRYQSTSCCACSSSSRYRVPSSSKPMSSADTCSPSTVRSRLVTLESQRLRYQGIVSRSAYPSGWTRRLSSWMRPLGMMWSSPIRRSRRCGA